MNILLALRTRDQSGNGCHLDISMADGMFTFMYWALGEAQAANHWPRPGDELVTGGSPRYQIYRTSDNRFVAAAPLEQKFWENFCQLIDLPAEYRGDENHETEVKKAVAQKIAQAPASYWSECFAGQDVCCSIVATLAEASTRSIPTLVRRLTPYPFLLPPVFGRFSGKRVIPAWERIMSDWCQGRRSSDDASRMD